MSHKSAPPTVSTIGIDLGKNSPAGIRPFRDDQVPRRNLLHDCYEKYELTEGQVRDIQAETSCRGSGGRPCRQAGEE